MGCDLSRSAACHLPERLERLEADLISIVLRKTICEAPRDNLTTHRHAEGHQNQKEAIALSSVHGGFTLPDSQRPQ